MNFRPGKFGRIVNLSMLIGGKVKLFTEKYKIDFDIELSTGGTFASAQINITGMSSVDIATVITNYNYQNKVLLPNNITLVAGYRNGATSIIFQGSAAQATASLDGPDKVLSMECTTAYSVSKENNNLINMSYPTTTLSAICSQLATQLGLIPLFKAKDKTITDFTYQGGAFGLINFLRTEKGGNLNIYFKDLTLVVEDSLQVDTSAPIICNSSTGMIGSPQPTFLGCNVKMLLNPLVKPGMSVAITSARIPQLNATYKILNVRHTGSSRDNYFTTELECTRFQ